MKEAAMTNNKTKRSAGRSALSVQDIAFIGMFGAVASVLMFLEFPLPFAPSFYELDFSEVPVLIGSFALGPVAGILIELIKILIHLVIKGTHTAGVGEVANFIIGCALVLPAGFIYRLRKNRKRALIGMAVGTLTMTAAGCLINAFVLLPTYAAAFGMPMEALIDMGNAVNHSVHDLATFAILCVGPFNLLKGVLVSVVTMILYKRISGLIKRVKA
jgi:riboflavin transporter FmnP